MCIRRIPTWIGPPTPGTMALGCLPLCISMVGGCWLGIGRAGFPSGYAVRDSIPSVCLQPLIGGLLHTGRLSGQGVALLSADYRLLSPSTGHDILEDIQDLFSYIRNDLNSALAEVTGKPGLKINPDAIGIAGTSSGGLCTYLCAIHISPKPRALLSMYGQGGECLVRYLFGIQAGIVP